MLLQRALVALLSASPSITAAMKAGKKASIHASVYRSATGKWEHLGEVSSNTFHWGPFLRSYWPGKTVVRFCVNGREYERTNF